MKIGWIPALSCVKNCCILALICSTAPVFALNGGLERATVHAMRKAPCMVARAAGNGEILPVSGGPEATVPNPAGTECVQYELRTGTVSYVIHPHRTILLEVGGEVSIKLTGRQLILQTSSEAKEIRCDVLSMTLRSEEERREKEREWEHDNQPSRRYSSGCDTASGGGFSCEDDDAFR